MRSPPHLYYVVIKEQPEAVTLDDGDVMTSVGTAGRRRKTRRWLRPQVPHCVKDGCMNVPPATVDDHSHQVVHAVWVGGVSRRVEQSELQGENDSVGQLGVAVELVHVLEALQVEGQDHGELLHPHPDGERTLILKAESSL